MRCDSVNPRDFLSFWFTFFYVLPFLLQCLFIHWRLLLWLVHGWSWCSLHTSQNTLQLGLQSISSIEMGIEIPIRHGICAFLRYGSELQSTIQSLTKWCSLLSLPPISFSTKVHTVPSKNFNWCDRFGCNWNSNANIYSNVASSHSSRIPISNSPISISNESTGIRWVTFWASVKCWRNCNQSPKTVAVTLLTVNGVASWVAFVKYVPMTKWFFRSMWMWRIGWVSNVQWIGTFRLKFGFFSHIFDTVRTVCWGISSELFGWVETVPEMWAQNKTWTEQMVRGRNWWWGGKCGNRCGSYLVNIILIWMYLGMMGLRNWESTRFMLQAKSASFKIYQSVFGDCGCDFEYFFCLSEVYLLLDNILCSMNIKALNQDRVFNWRLRYFVDTSDVQEARRPEFQSNINDDAELTKLTINFAVRSSSACE